ncbi:MAG TPA: hypothetical protein DER02_15155, partial [Gammaproteobacteria bacterium]|nr:hypothetical protein [Gammaproteobacteria bacterium]
RAPQRSSLKTSIAIQIYFYILRCVLESVQFSGLVGTKDTRTIEIRLVPRVNSNHHISRPNSSRRSKKSGRQLSG